MSCSYMCFFSFQGGFFLIKRKFLWFMDRKKHILWMITCGECEELVNIDGVC